MLVIDLIKTNAILFPIDNGFSFVHNIIIKIT